MKTPRLSRRTSLADLIEEYMKVPHALRKKPPSRWQRYKLAAVEREMGRVVVRGVQVKDLSQATLDKLQAVWRGRGRNVGKILTDAFISLWRFAAEGGVDVPGSPPRKVPWWIATPVKRRDTPRRPYVRRTTGGWWPRTGHCPAWYSSRRKRKTAPQIGGAA